ncbi:hypothetical protein ISN44_As06g023490 [Arabidopsis suecica]|uniref:Uncharacterized protein n=1 Tax=Arabidopsis suecica TaxID=45249 RepID=A0A8T2CIK6_ARASU|nr:hypothetical protein ISN44_As06g023490 [Arabidopsis suecica]
MFSYENEKFPSWIPLPTAVNAPAKPPPRNKRESCNIRKRNVMVIGNGVDSTISPEHFSNKALKLKLAPTQHVCVNAGFSSNVLPLQQSVKPSVVPYKVALSPSKSDDGSVSLDETMSSSDSYKIPQVEYIDNYKVSAVVRLKGKH